MFLIWRFYQVKKVDLTIASFGKYCNVLQQGQIWRAPQNLSVPSRFVCERQKKTDARCTCFITLRFEGLKLKYGAIWDAVPVAMKYQRRLLWSADRSLVAKFENYLSLREAATVDHSDLNHSELILKFSKFRGAHVQFSSVTSAGCTVERSVGEMNACGKKKGH